MCHQHKQPAGLPAVAATKQSVAETWTTAITAVAPVTAAKTTRYAASAMNNVLCSHLRTRTLIWRPLPLRPP